MSTNDKFEFRGISHLALVCRDMQRTIDFYSGVLGMPLTMNIELPNGEGNHFFFDIGGNSSRQLAFFWFPDAPDSQPGITHPEFIFTEGSDLTAVASMNHLALDVPLEKIEEYREKLIAAGIKVSEIINHDPAAEDGNESPEVTDTTIIRSLYFQDPDGILLEFASWLK